MSSKGNNEHKNYYLMRCFYLRPQKMNEHCLVYYVTVSFLHESNSFLHESNSFHMKAIHFSTKAIHFT